MLRGLVLMVVLLLVPCAYAVAGNNSKVVEKPLIARTLDGFNKDSARIRTQMEPGGIYDNISKTDKNRVEVRLGDMLKLLQANVANNDMDTHDKVALANAQEDINGILSHNDNNRLVCQHFMPVGSHIPITKCRTYAEIVAERRQTQRMMEKDLSTQQRKGGG